MAPRPAAPTTCIPSHCLFLLFPTRIGRIHRDVITPCRVLAYSRPSQRKAMGGRRMWTTALFVACLACAQGKRREKSILSSRPQRPCMYLSHPDSLMPHSLAHHHTHSPRRRPSSPQNPHHRRRPRRSLAQHPRAVIQPHAHVCALQVGNLRGVQHLQAKERRDVQMQEGLPLVPRCRRCGIGEGPIPRRGWHHHHAVRASCRRGAGRRPRPGRGRLRQRRGHRSIGHHDF